MRYNSDKNRFKDNGEYISESTIDRPPKAEKDDEPEAGQVEMFEKPTDEEATRKELDGEARYRSFGVELTLKLKRGRTFTVPLLAGEFNSQDIMGLIDLSLKGRKNRAVIDAILDNPPKLEVSKKEEKKSEEKGSKKQQSENKKGVVKKEKTTGKKDAKSKNQKGVSDENF